MLFNIIRSFVHIWIAPSIVNSSIRIKDKF